jgi:hypothetical protein
VVAVAAGSAVAVHECGHVGVVDHQVQVAVVVEIGVGRAVGVAGHVQPPVGRLVGEGEVAVVAEGIVGDALRGYGFDELEDALLIVFQQGAHLLRIGIEVDDSPGRAGRG